MNSRKNRKEALKEDIKHVLEELWDLEEEESLYKKFYERMPGNRKHSGFPATFQGKA